MATLADRSSVVARRVMSAVASEREEVMMNYQIFAGLFFLAGVGRDFGVLPRDVEGEVEYHRETLTSWEEDAEKLGTNHIMEPGDFMMKIRPWNHGGSVVDGKMVPTTEGSWKFPSAEECAAGVERVLSRLWGSEWEISNIYRGLEHPTSVGSFMKGLLHSLALEMSGNSEPEEKWAHWYLLFLLCRGIENELAM